MEFTAQQIADLLHGNVEGEPGIKVHDMSKIEEGDSGDPQKINAWLLRGRNGALNNLWICKITKNAQKDWSSLSNSGYFNSLEWRQPPMINQIELSDNN